METFTLDPTDLEKYKEKYSVADTTILEIKKAFDIIDFNRNGTIQPCEFEAMLEELGLTDDNDGISTKSIIAELDTNKNGFVDFEEFLDFALKKIDEKTEKEELEKLFAYYDSENNGQINVKDLEKVAKVLGQKISEEEAKKMLNLLDFNGDGFVEKQDFYNMIGGKIN